MYNLLDDGIVNLAHVQVNERLRYFVENDWLACQCEICMNDIKSYALNQLPPLYISNHMDIKNSKQTDFKSLDKALKSAILTIKRNPHH